MMVMFEYDVMIARSVMVLIVCGQDIYISNLIKIFFDVVQLLCI